MNSSLLPRWLTRAQKPAPAVQTPPPVPRGKKILIVDDDSVVLKATSLKLVAQGFTVVTATDASDAIGFARKEKPDVILLDITFPPEVAALSWDGFEIMGWLRRLESAKDIPIIVITGGDPSKYAAKATATGAAACFHKPLDHDRLLATIEQVLAPVRPTGFEI